MVGPGLLAPTRDVQNELKYFPANLFDRRLASGDSASIDVDQIAPFFG
jgi:hypothetical protein